MSIINPAAPDSHSTLTKAAKLLKGRKDGKYSLKISKGVVTFSSIEKMEEFKKHNQNLLI